MEHNPQHGASTQLLNSLKLQRTKTSSIVANQICAILFLIRRYSDDYYFVLVEMLIAEYTLTWLGHVQFTLYTHTCKAWPNFYHEAVT